MNIRETVERAVDPSRPRKSPAHLLLLPFAFGIMGACCYALVLLACALAVLSSKEVQGFSSYGETAKSLIVVPLLLASLPVGFLATNLLVWSIPPLRSSFDREAHGRAHGSFSASMRGLLKFAKYWMPPLLAIGFGAALFGR
jgi:hypothetical protein